MTPSNAEDKSQGFVPLEPWSTLSPEQLLE